jgi:hypothetical protein
VPILAMLATEFMAKANEDTHRAVAEFLRVGAKLSPARELPSQGQLATALLRARHEGAPAYEPKIAIDLAGVRIKEDRLTGARVVLVWALSAFPDGSGSTDWPVAQSISLEG